MRDKNRIPKVLESLEDVWKLVPDWRFGQLIENFMKWCGKDGASMFYTEDDRWRKLLDEYYDYLNDIIKGVDK